MSAPELRSLLSRCWHRALHDLEPARLVRDRVQTSRLPPTTKLIALGKAAPSMARGALDALGEHTSGIVVTTDGTPVSSMPSKVRVLRAAHPVPDHRSVQAANAALELANEGHADKLLVLVSGGASALACAPSGLSLEQKQAATDQLLRSGASIRACNTVRRHISGIKGGRLAAAFSGRVHTMIISDVVSGEPHDVGSGPACPDPTTIHEARAVISEHLGGELAAACAAACSESVKASSPAGKAIEVSVLAVPQDLAARFSRCLQQAGWATRSASMPDTTAQRLCEKLRVEARRLAPGHGWVVACEPTLPVHDGAGRGGRAGWVALRALTDLPSDVVLWAAASDGVDGTSGAAGACVWGSLRSELDPALVASHLASLSDARVHRSLGTAIDGGPTGVNLTDVYAVLRLR